MSRKFILLAAGACLAFIAYATLCSITNRPVFLRLNEPYPISMLERFAAYAVLGLLMRFAMSIRLSLMLVIGIAFALELLQYLVPGRDPQFDDALVKAAGGVAGILLAQAMRPRHWLG
jgi:hypothetical protein